MATGTPHCVISVSSYQAIIEKGKKVLFLLLTEQLSSSGLCILTMNYELQKVL